MPDIYGKVEAYNASGSSDAFAAVGANSRKTKHSTFDYGTPKIYPLVVIRNDEGDWTDHQLSNSDFHKVIAVMQTRGEIYGIGDVSGANFTVLVNWNTQAQDTTVSENASEPEIEDGDLDRLEDEVNAATGIGVNIYHAKIVGNSISYNLC
jgi:hypothetical protein